MKSTTPALDPLPNPRHEAFAREIASGRSATQGYVNVYGAKNRHVAQAGGSRLLRRQEIAARVRALQQAGAARVALDLSEILDFLARVVRTPAGEVLPSSDLCARVKRTRDGSLDVWMPNKLACLRLSAKLQGFLNTSGPSRTASQTSTTAQAETPAPPQANAQCIITEELRATLIARRKAAVLEDAEEQPQPPIPAKHPAEEQSSTWMAAAPSSPHLSPEQFSIHLPHAKQTLPQAEEQRPTEEPRRAIERPHAEAPPSPEQKRPAETPTRIRSVAPPASPEGCATVAGPSSKTTFPVCVPANLCPSKPLPNPEHHMANPARLSTLNSQQFTHSSRVTPDDSSTLIII